jgi:hypothetical protein
MSYLPFYTLNRKSNTPLFFICIIVYTTMSAEQFLGGDEDYARGMLEQRFGLIPDRADPDKPDELDRALQNLQLTGKFGLGGRAIKSALKARREAEKAVRKTQKTTEKKVVAGKAGKTENVAVDTKVSKQLPLLPQERTNMFNTLNKMSQEQLRKYVSTFNKEARIVGGHAMKKDELINAIIQKAKQVEGLLAKLRVDVPKIDRSVATKESTGTRRIAKDATGTKTRETEPKLVKPGEMKTTYKKIGGDGTFLAGYALKPASANRFDTLAQAQKACSGTDRCNGITKEVIKGKTYYSMRNGTTPMKKEGGGVEESWKKSKGKIIKLKDKK